MAKFGNLVVAAVVAVSSLAGLDTTAGATGDTPAVTAATASGRVDEPVATVSYGGDGVQGVSPARLLDTRPGSATIDGIAAGGGPIGPGGVIELAVAGRGGVPEAGAGAVVLNVTATGASEATHITAYPTGDAAPKASNLNLGAGDTAPNLVVVKIGRGGKVSLRNNKGTTHLLADVAGWFPEGSGFAGLTPARVLDTRPGATTIDGVAAGSGAVGAKATTTVPVTGRGGVPADAGAVVVNVTATGPTDATHITVFPSGETAPKASNLNLTAGQTRPNLVIVKVGADGAISLRNNAGSTHLIADVLGWFPPDVGFGGLSPARLLDTRPGATTIDGQAAGTGAVGAKATISVPVAGRGGVPGDAGAVVLNVTATGPTEATHVTVFPSGETAPKASNLNATAGQTVPNLVIAELGPDGAISLRNNAGQTHLIADVLGWFPDPTTTAQTLIGTKAGTVLAGAGDLTAATWSTPTTGTATIARSGDVPPVGGHLAVNPSPEAPSGFMGTVTGTTAHPDGTTTVTVAAANLQDAFTDLEIDGPITPPPGGDGAGVGVGATSRIGLDDCAGALGENGPSGSIDLGWGGGTFQYSLREQTARLQATVTPSVTLSVNANVAVSCSVDPPEWLVGLIGPITFDAELSFDFELSGSASGSVTAYAPLTIGFEYADGQTTNLSSLDIGGTGGLSSAELSMTLSAGFTGAIAGKAFGLAGFEIGIGPRISGVWEAPTCLKLHADVGAGLSGEIGRWGIDWDVSIAEIRTPPFVIVETDSCDDGIGNPDRVSGLVRYDVDTDVFEEIGLPEGGSAWVRYAEAFGSMTYRLDRGTGSYSGELDWDYYGNCGGAQVARTLQTTYTGSAADVPGTQGYRPPTNAGDGWSVGAPVLPPVLPQIGFDHCGSGSFEGGQLTWGTLQAGLCGDLFVEDLAGVAATATFAEGSIAGGGGDNFGEGTSYRCKVTYRITAGDDADHDGIPDDDDATPNTPDLLPT